jgi:hypothetical protein
MTGNDKKVIDGWLQMGTERKDAMARRLLPLRRRINPDKHIVYTLETRS